jgi:lipopolysaccharide assembly protein A
VRYVYIALVVAVTAIVAVFTIQNFQLTTVTLFQVRATLPLALLVLLVYALGMMTGGFVVSLLRRWVHRAAEHG